MEILCGSTIEHRDRILQEIPCKKPYFHPDYVNIMYRAEANGAPEFFLVKKGDDFVYYQYVRRDIAAEIEDIEPGTFFDIITPFDYGGYYCNNANLLETFLHEFAEYARQTNVISEFLRFLPSHAFENSLIGKHVVVQLLREQVYIDLRSGSFEESFNSGKRDNLRKARKNMLSCIVSDDDLAFYELYSKTMRRRNADDYFMFGLDAINGLLKRDMAELWFVLKNEFHVSGCVLLKSEDIIYYFLAATDPEFLSIGASTFLIHTIAERYRNNKSIFFLGGGKGSVNDFKRGFSKNRMPYFIGSRIHNQSIYERLVISTRRESNDYFPRYRTKVI